MVTVTSGTNLISLFRGLALESERTFGESRDAKQVARDFDEKPELRIWSNDDALGNSRLYEPERLQER